MEEQRRIQLQELLEELLGSDHVYFQPPASVRMEYPAIRYERNGIDVRHADNEPYLLRRSYSLTVIDWDPDSEIVSKISKLPMCRHNRHYTRDNLNHDVFVIYY